MVGKRGIEMQFHWIFILIAGAIILAFFFSLVAKQKSLSEEKLSISSFKELAIVLGLGGGMAGSTYWQNQTKLWHQACNLNLIGTNL